MVIDIDTATTELSDRIDRASSGEEIVSPHGEPLVRITPIEKTKPTIVFGVLKGALVIPDDFDAPLPDDVIASFEGR